MGIISKGSSNSFRKSKRRKDGEIHTFEAAGPLDRGILLIVFALAGIGLVQVYSSSFIFAIETYGDGLYFFKRQLAFMVLSFSLLLATARIPWRYLERWGFLLWMAAVGLVVATFIPGIGQKAGGAARWINFGFLRFEPAELMKLALPFIVGTFLVVDTRKIGWWRWPLMGLVVGGPIALLILQPDFGSMVICTLVLLILLFCFGLKWRYILASLMLMGPLFYYLVMMVPYRRARVLAFLDPWADPGKGGFQVIQSLLSLYSGGLTGVGLGQGQGKLFFLPEAHTDFTLAVLGEEMGFLGVSFVIFLYAFLIFRGFQVASRSSSRYAQAVALGITVTFALQVIINAGVALGLFPTKGLTLPFLSYGGSSLLMSSLMFGILLNLERYARPKAR